MANKAFEIQESTLRIGGVNLEAGTTTIVIPGVTQAANYIVEEVNEIGDQTENGWTTGSITVIDNSFYQQLVSPGNKPIGWAPAVYRAIIDDEENGYGFIDEIEITFAGDKLDSTDLSRATSGNMWAIANGAYDFNNFTTTYWVQIPFRPKMRAGEVTNVSSGSGGIVERSITFPEGEEGDTRGTLALTPSGDVYVCTADWGAPQTFEVDTGENYATGQTGGNVVFVIAQSAYPDLADLVDLNNPSEWSVTGELDLAGAGTWPVTSIAVETATQGDFQGEQVWWFFVGPLGLNYPTQTEQIPAGTTVELTFVPAIWEQVSTGGGGDRLVNGAKEVVLDSNGNLILSDDIISSNGHYYQDCSDGSTSFRWVNTDGTGGDQELGRAYRDGGTPYDGQGNEDNERVQFGYVDVDTNNSAFYIEATKNANGLNNESTDDSRWEFQGTGGLKFPDGSIQTTAYTGQSDGGAGALYIMANIDGNIVTSTNGVNWGDPQPSGMTGINKVEVHNDVIVYTSGSDGPGGPANPGLYYSTVLGTVTLCLGTDVSTVTDNDLFWNEVHYFSGPDKWVAVGYNAGTTNNVPAVAHSDDGITWTVVLVDDTFVGGFNTTESDWMLTDVAWLDETNQYVITSVLNGSLFGGIFLTDDITTALNGSNHVAIDVDTKKVAPWVVTGLGGPPGYMILMSDNNDAVWFGYGSSTSNYDLDDGWFTDSVRDQLGYIPSISEVAYRDGNFIAVTSDGQVITPTFNMGPGFAVSVPLAYTSTITDIYRYESTVGRIGTFTTPALNAQNTYWTNIPFDMDVTVNDDTFRVVINSDGYLTSCTLVASASDHSVDDIIILPGTTFGGESGPDAIVITVTGIIPATTISFSSVGNYTPKTNGEKITISGVTSHTENGSTTEQSYNGEYYIKTIYNGTNPNTYELYTDQALTTPWDTSTYWPVDLNTGTLTWSHGQYFDAAGVSNSYYYIGNDDEQIFRSSNGTTWTQQADFTGEYFNDFGYGSWGTSSVTANTVNYTPNNSDNWDSPTVDNVQAALDELAEKVTTGGGATLTSTGDVSVTAGSTTHWMASQRRDNYNTYNRAVRHDSGGNVYALTQTVDGIDDVAVITKYSPTGEVTWQHTIDKFRVYSLTVDSSDCAYIAGEKSNNTLEVWKFSFGGVVLWKKNYSSGYLTGECFIEERTNTRVTLVASRDDQEGDYGVIVLDINSSTGAVVTKKLINPGGPVAVYCSGIDTDASGNVVVTGRYYDPDDNKYKMFVEKLDTNLDRVWAKSVDTPNTNNMTAGDCASDAQGNVYAVAYYNINVNNVGDGNTTGTVGILIKLNSAGTTQWTRRLGPGPCGNGVVGLTATPVGDVYLATVTIEPSTNPQLSDYDKFAQGDIRMVAARYNTAGDVVWQRYIDDDHTWEFNDTFRGQAISVYNDMFVIDYQGNQTNNRQINWSGSADNEFDCFIVQLPTDGTDLEIGTMAFKPSRIPGRFITQAVTTSPLALTVFENAVVVVDSTLTIDNKDRIANSLVRSESYEYVFGADGTLTIPNDGDVKLTQSQIGFMATIGGMNNTWSDIQNYAVVVDSEGFMYVGGEEYNTYDAYVAKISPEGAREWSIRFGEDDYGHDTGVRGMALDPETGNVIATCDVYGNYNYSARITIDPDTGRILSNVEYRDSDADVNLEEMTFLSTGAWVAAGSKNGEFSPTQTATPVTGSTTQKIVVARSEIAGPVQTFWQIGGSGFSVYENIASVEQYSNLTGTVRQGSGAVFDITVTAAATLATITTTDLGAAISVPPPGYVTINSDNIVTPGGWDTWVRFPSGTALATYMTTNYTTNQVVPVTFAAGSTATSAFVIFNFAGDGTFEISPCFENVLSTSPAAGTWYFPMTISTPEGISVTVTSGGTNYRDGHKIKVLGSALSGVDVTNDMILTVTGTNAGAITSATGTQATILAGTFTEVSGSNYQTGSGYQISYFNGPTTTSNYANQQGYGVNQYGADYVVGDVITILGTDLGGATPANDMTITVTNTGGSGEVYNVDFSGTAQTTNWNITTYTNVDFSQPGSWTMSYPLSRECLLITADWMRTYGTNTGDNTDENRAIAIDSSDNIITVGQGYGVVFAQESRSLATVYKFNSAGTLQWSRQLNATVSNCNAKSVATIGTDIYVTHDEDGGDTVITKIAGDGTIQWQRTTEAGGDQDSVVVAAGDGDILIMTQCYQQDVDDDAIKIIKMTASGEIVYKRWFSANTNNDTRLRQGRNMAVRNGSMYIGGYYDTNNSNSTWLARLPVDGTGTGEYGQYRYTDVNAETGSYDYSGLYNVNYDVSEIELINSYAGALAVTPNVNSTNQNLAAGSGIYSINSFYENYFMEVIRDTDGGRIVFPDGTTQNTSAIDVPQRIHRGERYMLSLRDRGHHVLSVESNDNNIVIPYYARVPFPVGSQIVLVNDSGDQVNIGTEGSNISVLLSGSNGSSYNYFYMNTGSVATLLNIGRDRWVFYGNVDSN